MHSVLLAVALAGQYPSPQAPMYGAPPPAQYAAPMTYSAPVTYAAPQVVMLGAGQVIGPSPFGAMLGRLGQKLEKHAWPRVQPMTMAAQPAVQQTVYLQMSQPMVQQAVYSVAQPQYAAPPVQYAAPPQPMKAPPQAYGSPQASQYQAPQPQAQAGQAASPGAPVLGATKPSESVPPVPPR
jgi:hypothetical protein